jgi:hypothetical protein
VERARAVIEDQKKIIEGEAEGVRRATQFDVRLPRH